MIWTRPSIMHSSSALLVAAALTFPGNGRSQPGATSDALAHVQAIVAAAPNGDRAFRADAGGVVVQVQSGAVCVQGAAKMLLTKVEVFPTPPLGSDVGCEYQLQGGGLTSIFVSPLGSTNFDQAVDEIVRDIVKLHPGASLTNGPLTATLPSLEAPRAAAFAMSIDGQPSITSVWIARQGKWLITVRATYPASARHDPELLSSFQVLNIQSAIQRRDAG